MTAPFLETHIATVGASGSGKTVTAKGFAEALLREQRHLAVIDPTGAWWGMRSDASGDGPGFDIPIFGGARGDVPITADQGETVGKIIGDGVSAIVDVSELRTGAEQRRFVRDLCRALRAKPDGNFHLFVDEADEFAAQKPRDDYGFQVGEELIWMAKRGRLAGFVLNLITQRPASIDKEVLTQAQTIIVHQLVAPVDQKPIIDYLRDHADKTTLATIKSSLAKLDRGERWVYSPRLGLLERGASPLPQTFDSSRTPEPGEAPRAPKMLAEIDIGAIRQALAPPASDHEATPLKDESEALAALRSRVRELEAERDDWTVERAYGQQQLDALIGERDELRRLIAAFTSDVARVRLALADEASESVAALPPVAAPEAVRQTAPARDKPVAPRQQSRAATTKGSITGPQQRILDALAWWRAFGIAHPTNEQVGFVAGYSPGSGNYNNLRGQLRAAGMIDYPAGGRVTLTDAGVATARHPDTEPTRSAFHAAVRAKLKAPQLRLFDPVLAAYPSTMTTDALARAADYSAGSGNFNNIRGSLRTLDLIEYPQPGFVRASDWLFP